MQSKLHLCNKTERNQISFTDGKLIDLNVKPKVLSQVAVFAPWLCSYLHTDLCGNEAQNMNVCVGSEPQCLPELCGRTSGYRFHWGHKENALCFGPFDQLSILSLLSRISRTAGCCCSDQNAVLSLSANLEKCQDETLFCVQTLNLSCKFCTLTVMSDVKKNNNKLHRLEIIFPCKQKHFLQFLKKKWRSLNKNPETFFLASRG